METFGNICSLNSSLQFSFIYTRFLYSFLEWHDWSAAPISACLRCGPRSCFRRERCAGGEAIIAAPRVNCLFAPTHTCQRRAGKYCFPSLRYEPESKPAFQLCWQVLNQPYYRSA